MRGWPSCDRCGVPLAAGQCSGLCDTCDALVAPLLSKASTAPGSLYGIDRAGPKMSLALASADIDRWQKEIDAASDRAGRELRELMYGMPATSEAWKAVVSAPVTETHAA